MSYTVAVAQIAAIPTDPLATARKAACSLREAAAKGARLVVFPEALVRRSGCASPKVVLLLPAIMLLQLI